MAHDMEVYESKMRTHANLIIHFAGKVLELANLTYHERDAGKPLTKDQAFNAKDNIHKMEREIAAMIALEYKDEALERSAKQAILTYLKRAIEKIEFLL